MTDVTIEQENYKVSPQQIKASVKKILEENDAPLNSNISVLITSNKKVTKLALEYMKESKKEAMEHPVLSFPTAELEGPFVFSPEEEGYLGEVVVSYENATKISGKSKQLIGEVVCDLVEHGTLHLLGIHHD